MDPYSSSVNQIVAGAFVGGVLGILVGVLAHMTAFVLPDSGMVSSIIAWSIAGGMLGVLTAGIVGGKEVETV